MSHAKGTVAPIDLGSGMQLFVSTELDVDAAAPQSTLQHIGNVARPDFAQVAAVIERIGSDLLSGIRKIKPTKATVEFGVDVALQTPKLLAAVLVNGEAKADIRVTLEWSAARDEEHGAT